MRHRPASGLTRERSGFHCLIWTFVTLGEMTLEKYPNVKQLKKYSSAFYLNIFQNSTIVDKLHPQHNFSALHKF